MEVNKLIIFLVTSITFERVCGTACYKCSVPEEITISSESGLPRVTPSCSLFDGSSSYMTNCPYSTMCMKTISTMYLQNGIEQNTITRDCAPQQFSTLVFRNGSWEREHLVKEVYAEGCTSANQNDWAASKKRMCYCRGDLCNSTIIGAKVTKVSPLMPIIVLIYYYCYIKLH